MVGSKGKEVSSPAATKDEVAGLRLRDRALDASRDDALRAAALDLLAEVGYDRMSMDAVAARARAGKNTIYRRWPNKARLVVDALKWAEDMDEFPDTGSLRGDLEALIATVTSAHELFGAQVTLGVVTAVARDAELRQVFRNEVVEPRMAAFRELLERAVARGEIPAHRDLDLLALVYPALSLQHLVTWGTLPDTKFARAVMEEVLLPLAVAPPVTATRSEPR